MNNSIANNQSQVRQADNFQMDTGIILYGCFFYSCIFLIGTCGNILVIYVLLKEKELRNFTNYLLANLCIADLLVLFACAPTGLHDLFAKERWYLGKIMCYSIAFIENFTGCASLLTMLFITIDRYYVICKPLKMRGVMNQRRTMSIIGLIWFVSIALNAPLVHLSEYNLRKFSDNQMFEYRCDAKSRQTWSFYYLICATFLFYLLIGLLLIYMYYKISRKLKRSTMFLLNTTGALMPHQSSSDNLAELYACDSHKKMPHLTKCYLHKHIKQRKQVIFMLMCVICMFYVCLFPLKMWNLILMIGSMKIKNFYFLIGFKRYWYINVTCRIFFYLNSSINPILYNCLSKKFRDSFKRLLIFRLCFERHAKKNDGLTRKCSTTVNTNMFAEKTMNKAVKNGRNEFT